MAPMRRALVSLALLAAACRSPASEATFPPVVGGPLPITISSTTGTHSTFRGEISRIDTELANELQGPNWRPGCPVALEDLRLLVVSYWGFDGDIHEGPLILHEDVVEDVRWVFERLFRARFPIKHIALARRWHEPTEADYRTTSSITASFNCRPITEGTTLSQHSYGWAIDINPLQNPYIRADGSVLRLAAKPYRDRSLELPGMIHPGDVVVRSFARIGWEWGGDWTSLKDYMHFSLTGR